jgi:hypothetical protein
MIRPGHLSIVSKRASILIVTFAVGVATIDFVAAVVVVVDVFSVIISPVIGAIDMSTNTLVEW